MNHDDMVRITCATCDSKLGWHSGMLPYVLCEDCYADTIDSESPDSGKGEQT